MSETLARWTSNTTEVTEQIAAAFAKSRPANAERALGVHLYGDLGAGKTTWARGFLQSHGVAEVRSPSYALIETYRCADISVAHVDLYRLAMGSELEDLGLRELDLPGWVWLIEWPERALDRLPVPDLAVELTLFGERRELVARALTLAGEAWLRAATAAVPELGSL